MKMKDSLIKYGKLKRRLVTDGIFAGILGGFFSLIYRWVLSQTDVIRNTIYRDLEWSHILIWLVICTVAGLVIGRLIEWEPLSSGSGIPQVQGEILGLFEMKPLRIILAKMSGGVLSNLTGLSLGREGPSIQIGAAMGKVTSKLLKRDATEETYLISAGASAGLAAAFNAPLAGTLFTLEEMHKNFSPLILIPSLIAAVIADFMSKYMFGLNPVFHFQVTQSLPLEFYHFVVLAGILTGLIGVLFIKAITFFQDAFQASKIAPRYWPVVAILLMAAIGYVDPDFLGGGHHLMEEISGGSFAIPVLASFLLVKLAMTAVSYGSKAQGGIFLPVLVLGGITGLLIFRFVLQGGLLDASFTANFIIFGMAGILTAVVRSPILSIILVTEMTGSFSNLLPLSLVAICAYLTAELLKTPPIYEILLERLLGKQGESQVETKRVIHSFRLPGTSVMINKKVKELSLPAKTLLIAIDRSGEEIIPDGNTVLRAGDEITVVIYSKNISLTKKYLEAIYPPETMTELKASGEE